MIVLREKLVLLEESFEFVGRHARLHVVLPAEKVALVAEEEHGNLCAGGQEHLGVDVLLPLEHRVEGLAGGHVVDDHGSDGVRVEDLDNTHGGGRDAQAEV